MATFPIDYSEVGLLYRQTIAKGLGIITIASAEPGEGRTLLSKTLAERAAASNQKTLLVDLDISNPKLHELYNQERKDWLPQQDENYPFQMTKVENLFLLPAPKQSASRWEFRDIASLLACFNNLRNQFEVIIIDTSPLGRRNQGNVPPETLCSCADATLLCVMTGITGETKIRDTYDLLRSVNANIQGAILNDRFAPSLVSELIRETFRLEKVLPSFMTKLRNFLRNSTLLNQDI